MHDHFPSQEDHNLFLYILGNCKSREVYGRIECGWVNITKEHCLARDCCYDITAHGHNARSSTVNCFVKPHLGE